jgi:hypothetical protein
MSCYFQIVVAGVMAIVASKNKSVHIVKSAMSSAIIGVIMSVVSLLLSVYYIYVWFKMYYKAILSAILPASIPASLFPRDTVVSIQSLINLPVHNSIQPGFFPDFFFNDDQSTNTV